MGEYLLILTLHLVGVKRGGENIVFLCLVQEKKRRWK